MEWPHLCFEQVQYCGEFVILGVGFGCCGVRYSCRGWPGCGSCRFGRWLGFCRLRRFGDLCAGNWWKRLNFAGAMAGIIVGAAVDILWLAFLAGTGVYEIVPGFIAGLAAAVIVTLTDKKPDAEVEALFDQAVSSINID